MSAKNTSRGASGTGTIRKRTVKRKGRDYTFWEGRVTVGFDLGTGRQIQRSISGKTQKEVIEKMQALSVDLTMGNYQEPSKLTLGDWLDIWLREYSNDKKYLTLKNYRAQVEAHIKPSLGAVKLQQLAPHMIQSFYNECLRCGKTVPERNKRGEIVRKNGKIVYHMAPMSPKTVRNIHGVLTKALSVAVGIGYLRVNPADNVTLPRVERKELSPLNDEQVKAFLKRASEDDYGILLKVILFTGLRESEALGLTWDCIDFDAGVLKISKQLQKRRVSEGGATLVSPKNGKPRVIKPAPFVINLLRQQQKDQAALRLLMGTQWQGWADAEERKTALAFTTPEGKSISHTSLRYHFKKVVEDIGCPDCRVHDLRHTYAVLSLQNGDDIKTVQSNLGHATAAFTLDVYGHVSERMKDESAARMEAYIAEVQGL